MIDLVIYYQTGYRDKLIYLSKNKSASNSVKNMIPSVVHTFCSSFVSIRCTGCSRGWLHFEKLGRGSNTNKLYRQKVAVLLTRALSIPRVKILGWKVCYRETTSTEEDEEEEAEEEVDGVKEESEEEIGIPRISIDSYDCNREIARASWNFFIDNRDSVTSPRESYGRFVSVVSF